MSHNSKEQQPASEEISWTTSPLYRGAQLVCVANQIAFKSHCCLSSSTIAPPGGGDLLRIDLPSAQSSSFWTFVPGNGIKKAIPRGYTQACGSVGVRTIS